jgi:hypothetical protein
MLHRRGRDYRNGPIMAVTRNTYTCVALSLGEKEEGAAVNTEMVFFLELVTVFTMVYYFCVVLITYEHLRDLHLGVRR